MLNRRELLKLSGAATLATLLPGSLVRAAITSKAPFRFCLNTSTISGQQVGLLKYIDIAAQAGYDGVELWVSDVKDYLDKGNSIQSLATFIKARGITVEDAISFTTWMVDDETKRKDGLIELEKEMKMMAVLGCHRIAAPPAGVESNEPINFQTAGKRYHDILALGRKYNVMPLLEFWGASGTLYNLSQALAIAAAADDADARILPDVYHLFRGGSGFNSLKLLNGRMIDIIHMNDYPASKPREEQTDGDRVYPGDGTAPLKQLLRDLMTMGGTKVLSLELFNENYWKQDALLVAKTGLQKMKLLVNGIINGK
ncbi:sugar phosphate isomerase/epimerase [Panacibacter ginsenosidivorans]|uniref:Sugar phosphate isomerase/epimerase n=1 Tax=Panacibacter ginsenosidivorans TaxID=1813871 RepID=A0A5B8VAF1_9BACT|nr:TIM barrel protein [Panacibacter ginsenosidivorans]QEC68332.1 sugar phosphate isomerase/epimerase [Panacibacter ginsenosidivorans]